MPHARASHETSPRKKGTSGSAAQAVAYLARSETDKDGEAACVVRVCIYACAFACMCARCYACVDACVYVRCYACVYAWCVYAFACDGVPAPAPVCVPKLVATKGMLMRPAFAKIYAAVCHCRPVSQRVHSHVRTFTTRVPRGVCWCASGWAFVG